MVTYCCCYGCKERYSKGSKISFHSFPKDERRRKLWTQSIRRKNFVPTIYSKVCSKHFTETCFDREKFGGVWLKSDAVPTVFNFPKYWTRKVTAEYLKKPLSNRKTLALMDEMEEEPLPDAVGQAELPVQLCDIKTEEYIVPDWTVEVKVEQQLQVDVIKEEPCSDAESWPGSPLGPCEVKTEECGAQDLLSVIKDEQQVSKVKVEDDELFEQQESKTESNVNDVNELPGDMKQDSKAGMCVSYEDCAASNATAGLLHTDTNYPNLSVDIFKQNDLYDTSLTSERIIGSYQLDVTQDSFSEKDGNSQHHIKTDQLNKTFVCDVCNKVFSQKRYLKTHCVVHIAQESYKCDVCSKVFIRQTDLKKHQLIHFGRQSFTCDVCNKGFIHRGNLNTHRLIHTGQRPHKCDICNRTFISRNNLNAHQVLHTGQQPYKCDVCDRLFSWRSSFKSHQLIHTGQKPFKCDVCNKAFRSQTHVKRHMVVHTVQQPHKCDVCSAVFIHKKSLKSHLLIHERPGFFNCDVWS